MRWMASALCFRCKHCKAITVDGDVICEHPELSGRVKQYCRFFKGEEGWTKRSSG